MKPIKAFIINRNLLSTLKHTVEFLQRNDKIEVWILDQNSTYPPLLDYYSTNPCNIYYCKANIGHLAYWSVQELHDDNYFIVCDPDCTYNGIPDDWLDVMLSVLNDTTVFKVGFSIDVSNLPPTTLGKHQKEYQQIFWKDKNKYGWIADIDTTFALYRPNSQFGYSAIRLDVPYTMQHYPWYIIEDNITEEWMYYLSNVEKSSTCKSYLNEIKLAHN